MILSLLKQKTLKDMEMRQNVWAHEMGVEEGSRDYSYGLYLNGQPKAMVMVLDSADDHRLKSVKLAHRACEEKGSYAAPVKDEAYPTTIWHFAGNGGTFSLVAISTAGLLQSRFAFFFLLSM